MAHKQTDTYIPSCEDCCLMPEDERINECDSHKSLSSILQNGNPTYYSSFTDSTDKIQQLDQKSTEGSQLNKWYHGMFGSHMTAICQAILTLTYRPLSEL